MTKIISFQVDNFKEKNLSQIQNTVYSKDYNDLIKEKKKNTFGKNYDEVLNICFSEKPKLIKFDSETTDEDIDRFFDSY